MNLRNTAFVGFFCLQAFWLIAQVKQPDYTAAWKKVDSLVNQKGLVQSALSEVNIIYARAKQEKNDAQLIRSLIYRESLQGMVQMDAAPLAIADLEKEIAIAGQPARSILQSILANTYWNYFQQHRWQLYNRTTTVKIVSKDIATWSIGDFHQKIGELYLSSLREERLLQQTKLDGYEPILVKGNVRTLRPTLFDLLAHQALDYFKTDERDINRPVYAFEIDDPLAFADARTFIDHVFRTRDSLSLHYKALLLFQRLIGWHLSDPKPDALLDVDIERLNFVHSYAVSNIGDGNDNTGDKEELYMRALAHITDRYGNEPAAAEAWYLQALQYATKAEKYDPVKDTANRYAYVQAKTICEKVLAQTAGRDSTEGKTHCEALLKNIRRKILTLQTEKVNLPGMPLRTLVTWRNIGQLYARIIRAGQQVKEGLGLNTWQDQYWEKLLRLPVLKTFELTLPATGDYQLHRTEIKIDELPVGEYILLVSSDKDFPLTQNPLAFQYFYVSSIAYIDNDQDYFVLNRESGQPLAGATVQIWEQRYNYRTSKNTLDRGAVYHTDASGHFLINREKAPHPETQLLLDITTAGDHLFLQDQPVNTYYYDDGNDDTGDRTKYEKDNTKTFFFTDRGIYRPGQTVYFKGIVVGRDYDTRQPRVQASFPTKVMLYDANRTRIDSLMLTTNEFGSYQGKFILPEHLLNGEFSIEDDSTGNMSYFSVEEYKRPKFYVEYAKLKGGYRLGDTIRISGTAKAYAGSNIDGATVKYRVLRKTRYPYPWYGGRWGRPLSTKGQEIAHGETKTDAAGKFAIGFLALPDLHADKTLDPIFDYQISADITDINGETRSGETTAAVGYKALLLTIHQPALDNLPADSLRQLAVSATNLSGQPDSVPVRIAIYKLHGPDRLIRQRLWEEPDQFVIPEKEYRVAFPHDEYRDETKKETWEKDGMVDSGQTSSTGQYRLQGKNLQPGWYVIEASATDKYGNEVKSLRYIALFDRSTGRPADPQYNWAMEQQQPTAPGEKAVTGVGSSAERVFVIQKTDREEGAGSRPGATGAFSYLTLNNEKKRAEFTVREADRGGFGVSYAFIKDNRVYTNDYTVSVPWTNKELTIQYTSFRDKTLPGSEEKWQVKIAGYKKDKVAAEAVAAMYDASLDQFKPHNWETPDLYPTYSPRTRWANDGNFSTITSQNKYVNEIPGRVFYKSYDRILSGPGGQAIRIRGNASVAYDAVAAPRNMALNEVAVAGVGKMPAEKRKAEADSSTPLSQDTIAAEPPVAPPDQIQVRRDLRETAFFFPDLRTDSAGNIGFSFTMPEALTRWKWLTLAHTRDLSFGYAEKTVVTQKQLMVQPNAPRFLREGDRLELSAKIVNLTDSELTGQASLQLTDPTTGQTADGWYTNQQPNQYFTVEAGSSTVVSFPLTIPYQYNRPLTYRIMARAPLPRQNASAIKEEMSDGEEATLPVVSNRMLVTETLPLNMPGDGSRSFRFDKLLQSGNSQTLSQYALTVEFTGNPAWYAVQALPYLMEFPYECAEQTFNRFYANVLASKIAGSSPRIRQIFDRWKTADTAALLSNLEKDQELKSVLLQETPWVLQGKSETQQKRNIALLFDMDRMSRELESSLQKLQQLQSPNGGFVWFKGGPDDRYITQYILTGIGRLQKLQALPASVTATIKSIVATALPYLDQQIKKDYEEMKKRPKPLPQDKTGWIGELAVQYLYMRSAFSDYGIPGDVFPAVNYYRRQAQQFWLQTSKYMQGMIALALYRTGDIRTAKDILASLRQNAIRDAEKGMYWKGMEGGYYWYQAPIEMQSLLIEAFHEIDGNPETDNALRTWLLKQKQTHNWATTKATADACYALLLGGSDWLQAERNVEIRLGDKTIHSDAGAADGTQPSAGATASTKTEAGTGYFKKVFDGPFVNPSMGNITVTMHSQLGNAGAGTAGKTGDAPAWGAAYWQYFDNLDNITPPGGAVSPLSLVKKLFIEKNTDRGPVLEPVAENGTLHVGDKVKVRIELRSDRDLEYVHMKDMRASCMEPVNVLSQYKWQGGLGYYESTKDVSTDFFFSQLPRGTYVFEYSLFVGQVGNFSNGITGIECMYAPEFAFHSEGIRVSVE